MLAVILLGFLLAIISIPVHRLNSERVGNWLSIVPLGIFIWSLTYLDRIILTGYVSETYQWVNSIGLSLSFRLDGLSLFFVLLISGVGFFIYNYANSYLHHDSNKGKFFLYLSLFMTSMLGVVMSGNLIILFIFWELTSLSSYLLIGDRKSVV